MWLLFRCLIKIRQEEEFTTSDSELYNDRNGKINTYENYNNSTGKKITSLALPPTPTSQNISKFCYALAGEKLFYT